MSIRQELSGVIADHRTLLSLTYDDMIELTGLNRTQLTRVIKHSGEGVSIELLESVAVTLGYNIDVDIWRDDFDDV